jgi:tetratricopeptide (TPR) repeat protein
MNVGRGAAGAWVAIVLLAAGAVQGQVQDREYHVSGSVLTTDQQPIADAAVELRERTSRRSFKTASKADGKFKMVGLPHGTYEVRVSKAGYQARSDEWDLREAQVTMKKVELKPYLLLSDAQAGEIERDTRLRGLVDKAAGLLREGDFDGALVVLEEMLAAEPDDVNALYMKGLCHVQKGRPDIAVTSLKRVVELSPGFAAAHLNLGVCYEQLGEKENALASYDRTLELEPGNPLALYNAGVLHYNAGRVAEALPYFEKGVAVNPDDDRALEMAGYCELHAERYAEALQNLERARALITDPARAATLDELIRSLRERIGTPKGNGNE